MNQLVFNILLSPAVKGLTYKFFLKVRALLLSLKPDATVVYRYKRFELLFPFSHDYPLNKKTIHQYSENLGIIASLITNKYADAKAIDVGANIGDSAAIIQSYTPMPMLCIEGNPKFIPMLLRNKTQLNDITIEACFVGEKGETVIPVNTGGTAHLEASDTGVEVKTMEHILNQHTSFAHAKLLKIDTDGFDHKIIRASLGLLSRAKPVVFFEYDPYFLFKQNEKPQDIFPLLHSLGYSQLVLFDNLGKLLCVVSSQQTEILSDFTNYFNNSGQTYMDICAVHQTDEELIPAIRNVFSSRQ